MVGQRDDLTPRTKTGIPGLDELIGGGLVRGSTTLLSGPTGAGKTIFGFQFLYTGAAVYNEPGVLITLETRPHEVRNEAMRFGWDFQQLEAENKLMIVDAASNRAGLPTFEKHALRRGFDMATLAEEIYAATSELRAQRLVLDSIMALDIRLGDSAEVRNAVYRISALLRELGVTSLLIGEFNGSPAHGHLGMEQYVTQGLILLDLEEIDSSLRRSLVVWKMRQTAHSLRRHRFVIASDGIRITS